MNDGKKKNKNKNPILLKLNMLNNKSSDERG